VYAVKERHENGTPFSGSCSSRVLSGRRNSWDREEGGGSGSCSCSDSGSGGLGGQQWRRGRPRPPSLLRPFFAA